MKERPIILSASEVRAVLDGGKTQHRVPVRLPRISSSFGQPLLDKAWVDGSCLKVPYCGNGEPSMETTQRIHCPHGVPGDRLWVREAWQEFFDDEWPEDRPRGPVGRMGCPATPDRVARVFYRADWDGKPHDKYGDPIWIPSANMPHRASRITLDIVSVRVERVQDIIEEDARADGVRTQPIDCVPGTQYRTAFEYVWDRLHARRGHGWDANPWVWVIEFRSV